MAGGLAGEEECASEVQPVGAVELGGAEVVKTLAGRAEGGVDDAPQGAEAIGRGLDAGGDGGFIADVERGGEDRTAGQRGFGSRETVCRKVGDDEIGAEFGQQLADRQREIAGAAGDENRPAAEVEAGHSATIRFSSQDCFAPSATRRLSRASSSVASQQGFPSMASSMASACRRKRA